MRLLFAVLVLRFPILRPVLICVNKPQRFKVLSSMLARQVTNGWLIILRLLLFIIFFASCLVSVKMSQRLFQVCNYVFKCLSIWQDFAVSECAAAAAAVLAVYGTSVFQEVAPVFNN